MALNFLYNNIMSNDAGKPKTNRELLLLIHDRVKSHSWRIRTLEVLAFITAVTIAGYLFEAHLEAYFGR